MRPRSAPCGQRPGVSGPLAAGRAISFTLAPNAAVTVDTSGGSPALTLSNGGSATYAEQDTGGNLLFTATVASGQDTADLKVTGLALNGATITDADGLALDASALTRLPGSDTGLAIDTIPPAVTAAAVTNPADPLTRAQMLAGSGDPGATVTISENGQVVGTTEAGADGSWTYEPSGLPPGAHILTASETDTAGNDGTASAVLLAVPDPRFDLANATDPSLGSLFGTDYTGPVGYLQAECGSTGPGDVILSARVANVFLHSGAGMDALAVKAGRNVLDGGAGSNWLVGADGSDGGTDTFFVGAGNGQHAWDTLLDFHPGDMLTLWGFDSASGSTNWSGKMGADGYRGATLNVQFGGGSGSDALVTFAGLTTGTAQFATSTGSSGGLSYLAMTRVA